MMGLGYCSPQAIVPSEVGLAVKDCLLWYQTAESKSCGVGRYIAAQRCRHSNRCTYRYMVLGTRAPTTSGMEEDMEWTWKVTAREGSSEIHPLLDISAVSSTLVHGIELPQGQHVK